MRWRLYSRVGSVSRVFRLDTTPEQGRRQVGSVMSELALNLRQQRQEQAIRAFPLFR